MVTAAEELLELGARLQLVHPREAAGRCLSASLDFAWVAMHHHGIDVELVKWRVVGDPGYSDHWAVALDDATVIDLTHVQVDGQPMLTASTRAYPRNFRDLRRYPASLLLDVYTAGHAGNDARLPSDFVWFCGNRLLRFDLAAAWCVRDPGAGAKAVGEFGRFLLRYNVHRMIRALERRASTLLARLPATTVAAPAGNSDESNLNVAATERPRAWRGLAPPRKLASAGAAFTPALTAHINSACTLLLACTSFAPIG